MTTSRTLQAEDRVAHYRVVGPLGAGGMGEVYLAQDQKLERSVALKVLPPELVRSADRVRRFVQEAKSASSLNHPNIITIYEIGEEPVTSASGENSPDPVHYISMELVSGRTLSTKIHEENTDLRTLLGYLAQAAEGIAKAHATGIVHRDLKPGNIMVTDDGFAKVLDFGLAKLTEKHGPEAGTTLTTLAAGAQQTVEGTILGTVHYMSPEQVQGKTVDFRSDIFSFGCILYEAATRQRPFSGDSHVETMHKILHDRPVPIEEFDETVPNELRRLIRRCLRKSPDQRLQSMKDLALELREIVEEYDELSISGTGAMSSSALGMAPLEKRRPILLPILAIGILVVAAAAYFGLRGRGAGSEQTAASIRPAKFVTATNSGMVSNAAISRDGRYLAYISQESDGSTMYVRQVATGADVQVIPKTTTPFFNPSFSPDGNYLFYTMVKPEAPRYRTLYRIPSLGGQPEERGFDVDSPVSFSPDGSQMAFVRFVPNEGGTVQVQATNGGETRELIRIPDPDDLQSQLSWSPDGKYLAIAIFSPPPITRGTIALINAKDGTRKDFFSRQPAFFNGISWKHDGSALVVTGVIPSEQIRNQIIEISYPGGKLRHISNDLFQYAQPWVSQDGTISAVRQTYLPDIYTLEPESGNFQTIVRSTSADTAPVGFALGEKLLAYIKPWEGGTRLYAQSPESNSAPRSIATGDGLLFNLDCGGNTLFFTKLDPETGESSLWRVGIDGSGLKNVAEGAVNLRTVSHDGRYYIYNKDSDPTELWIQDTESGKTRLLPVKVPGRTTGVVISPDSKQVLVAVNDTTGALTRTIYRVLPVDGDGSSQRVEIPENALATMWIPGENAIAFVNPNDPLQNIWRLSLDGGDPTPLTAFAEGRRTRSRFSYDHKYLVSTLSLDSGDNLWISKENETKARQLTSFTGKTIFWWGWLGDSSRIVLAAGESNRDVVLVRDFR
ncbi:MAG TPA: protein kinase [Candidatus Krumholzibacteria bacterium]|nr:protein kinase [Candidatus Krumholzibacteria bacterium]